MVQFAQYFAEIRQQNTLSYPHPHSVVWLVLGSGNGVSGNDYASDLMLGFILNHHSGTSFCCESSLSKMVRQPNQGQKQLQHQV